MKLLAAAFVASLLWIGQSYAQGVGFPGSLPVGTPTSPGILQCGSGVTCVNGIISSSGGGGGNVSASGGITPGTVPVWASSNAISGTLPYSISGFNVLLQTQTNGQISSTVIPPINLASGNAGGVTGSLPNSNLSSLLSNQVLGTLSAGTPGGLTVPVCSSSNQGLGWASGIGYQCNTYPAAITPGAANTPLFANGTGGFTNGTRSGSTTTLATISGGLTSGDFASFDASGNIIDLNSSNARNALALGPFATATSINLSTQTSGILPSNQGGAGSVTGILKSNGSGAVTAATPGADYLVSNQSITLSGAISGTGSTSIATSLATGAAAANIGSLSSDLSGTLPSPTVVGLQGRAISNVTPTSGQFFEYNGISWGPVNAPVSGINALTQDVTATGTGSQPATVVGIQGRPVSNTAPTTNQLMGWSGTSWGPTNAPASGISQLTGAITAGPGTGMQSATIVPTGVIPGSYTVASSGGLYYCQVLESSGQVSSMTPGTCGALVTNDSGNVLITNDGGNALVDGP